MELLLPQSQMNCSFALKSGNVSQQGQSNTFNPSESTMPIIQNTIRSQGRRRTCNKSQCLPVTSPGPNTYEAPGILIPPVLCVHSRLKVATRFRAW